MNRFQDKVAIVTGGASGIGAATVMEFAIEGAKVVLVDLDRRQGEAYARTLGADNLEARYVEGNIASAPDCRMAVEQALAAFGQVDIVVNGATSFVSAGSRGTAEEWEQSLGTNVIGTTNMTQAAVPSLIRSKCGVVVHVASVSAYIAQAEHWAYTTPAKLP